MERLLYGRELLATELPKELQEAIKKDTLKIQKKPSFYEKKNKKYCRRCQSPMIKVASNWCVCKQSCSYCRNCIQMGKVRSCDLFYYLPEANAFNNYQNNKLAWEGILSEQQSMASKKIVKAVKTFETLLLWAVTGAGKTEMLFKGIEEALLNKKRVCIATPRIDVALELSPRILSAFPQTELAILYGEMETPYQYTQLVITTTHQLYRFKEAFDVLIIDEMDAFPFHLDDGLKYAAKKARKSKSTLIYLSATPDKEYQKMIKKKELEAVILPARYHGKKLPVPITKRCNQWNKKILEIISKTSFGQIFHQYIEQNKRFIIFVPNIEWMLELEKKIKEQYSTVNFESVSAQDPQRKEKVMAMRNKDIQFLISTTILERGVTFPDIHVLVIGAEDRIFTESALVQIAGRCGRSAEYPTGEVIFFHDGQSLSMKRAIKQIKKMNQLALKRGLIHG